MVNHHRRTWAEIDLDNLKYNFLQIKSITKSKICCVIKADGYGHGAVELGKLYQDLGADFFGVSNIDEALQLRRAKITLPILIFGFTPPCDAKVLYENNISQCVYSLDYAKQLSAYAKQAGALINIHIKVDTGMSRLGFFYQDASRDYNAVEEINTVCSLPGLNPQGIFTHFSVADEGKSEFTEKQIWLFSDIVKKLKLIHFDLVHASNSGGILDFPSAHFNMVRAGIILYGLEPSTAVKNPLKLRPALSLKSVVSHIKTVKPGSDISYGRDFTAKTEMSIATVPIGYADGFSRILASAGVSLLIHGTRCKVVGRVCMDQLMVDIGSISHVNIGDTVTILGVDGSLQITAEELAFLRGTINYEVICDIGARVPRIYLKNGEEVGMLNYIGGDGI